MPEIFYEFEHPNMVNFTCPVCKTMEDKPVVLVGDPGTAKNGIMEARQVHTECLRLSAKMVGVEITVRPWNEES